MCHKETTPVPVLLLAGTLLASTLAFGQAAPEWRKIGTASVDLRLAGPATGGVAWVWFSPGGSTLRVLTGSGQVFETADFETWMPATPADAPAGVAAASASRLPEPGAHVLALASDAAHLYALGQNLFRSEDGGRSWSNLTGFKSHSIVGGGIRSVAVPAGDPDQVVAASDFGVWRSMDGGRSWVSLNLNLPNLDVRRILSTPTGTAGTRVQAEGFGLMELPPGGTVWQPAADGVQDTASALNQKYSAILSAEITAVAISHDVVYAGASDGRIFVSPDGGKSFAAIPWQTGGRVERLWADATEPRVALAALSGNGPHVLRTTNNGGFWDVIDVGLPRAPARGVTADRAAGAVYVATDQGVFYGQADLENASSNLVKWQSLTSRMPAAPATDVALDPAGVQLYIAVQGYGVYAAAAPHRARSPRLVNAADFSTRPAAPGSLLSLVGARVTAAGDGELNYPVLAASDTESQIQVPFEAVGPNVELALATAAGSMTLGLPVRSVSPAILIARDGTPAVFDADSGLPLDARNAIHSNGRIWILATGLGKVQPTWPTGLAAPLENPPAVAASVKAYLDGNPVQVTSATLAPGYVGFYRIEVQMPAVTNAGTASLLIAADGQESNAAQIVILP